MLEFWITWGATIATHLLAAVAPLVLTAMHARGIKMPVVQYVLEAIVASKRRE